MLQYDNYRFCLTVVTVPLSMIPLRYLKYQPNFSHKFANMLTEKLCLGCGYLSLVYMNRLCRSRNMFVRESVADMRG